MRKYVTEFIGTFGLVFTVGCAVMGKAALAPLAIGAALMVFRLRRRAHLRRALQPGGEPGCLPARQAQPEGPRPVLAGPGRRSARRGGIGHVRGESGAVPGAGPVRPGDRGRARRGVPRHLRAASCRFRAAFHTATVRHCEPTCRPVRGGLMTICAVDAVADPAGPGRVRSGGVIPRESRRRPPSNRCPAAGARVSRSRK